ncbi:MAG: hypothetical protein WDN28_03670 [Chthoniobacter sp.]
MATDGDHRLDGLLQKFPEVFGAMRQNIDADFRHHLDGERMHEARRLRPRAGYAQMIPPPPRAECPRRDDSGRNCRCKE